MGMTKKLFYLAQIVIFLVACNPGKYSETVRIKKLDYPSASAIEFYEGKLYLMGDDATKLLVLDTSLNVLDSIPLLSYPGKRIPKDIKPDLEASALNADNLFLFGSGSLSPYRNSGWRFNLKTKDNDSINLEPLYLKAKSLGIEQINFEGACFVAGKLILVNRGNESYPHNHFVITNERFWDADSNLQMNVVTVNMDRDDNSPFKGISGLCYAKESDKLIMTVSTEDTKSSYEDGAIGKSYLWIINGISTKLNGKTIGRSRAIDLEYIDSRFKGQKIESATVIDETDELISIAMVADNDDGSSTVFKMSISKIFSHVE
jgi:hypothetical protein